jgi:NTP pyrophosphatase (non-canonical NTP hydrolase)
MFNELAEKIHKNAVDHGFYDEEKINIPEKLMLIVSELGEAMEAYRKEKYANIKLFNAKRMYVEKNEDISKIYDQDLWDNDFLTTIKDSFEDEIADTIIRILDLCDYMKIDINKHIELKMKYNENRPYKHGKIC